MYQILGYIKKFMHSKIGIERILHVWCISCLTIILYACSLSPNTIGTGVDCLPTSEDVCYQMDYIYMLHIQTSHVNLLDCCVSIVVIIRCFMKGVAVYIISY